MAHGGPLPGRRPPRGAFLQELRAVLADHPHLAVEYVAGAIEVMLTIRAGRLEEAEKLADGCFERGVAAGDIDATGWYGGQLGAIRWYQGRAAELLPALADLVNSPTLSPIDNSYVAGLALAAAVAGTGGGRPATWPGYAAATWRSCPAPAPGWWRCTAWWRPRTCCRTPTPPPPRTRC
ncbi:hypothetical protein ACFQQB_06915 [Nonomuraea rubra]|uniref:hypothetical protein n=1 Tax=Nonomuraea rubra TaxID=46180 RepID=UPI0036164F95